MSNGLNNVQGIPDKDLPFEKRGEHDIYWGYSVWTDPGPTYALDVWVQNPRYGDDNDPVADYDDLWDAEGKKIEIEDAEEAGWIADLHDATLQDLYDTYEPEPGW